MLKILKKLRQRLEKKKNTIKISDINNEVDNENNLSSSKNSSTIDEDEKHLLLNNHLSLVNETNRKSLSIIFNNCRNYVSIVVNVE